MDIKVMGEQLILSGPVVTGDCDAVASHLSLQPQIKTVILRNSPGGNAPTGDHLGELFRQKSLKTAVSGYCHSSCSRLFVGGKERDFTDDYPPEHTQIGLHGHYDGKGDLNAALVNALHLKDWIIRYSDGKADEALAERWINIPRGTGLIHFYNPALIDIGGYSTSHARAPNPIIRGMIDCERIGKNALDLGIATAPTLVRSHDQQQIRQTILQPSPPSGFAAISDESSCPAPAKPAGKNIGAFSPRRHQGRSTMAPAGTRPGMSPRASSPMRCGRFPRGSALPSCWPRSATALPKPTMDYGPRQPATAGTRCAPRRLSYCWRASITTPVYGPATRAPICCAAGASVS
jgi:hypothetical protein